MIGQKTDRQTNAACIDIFFFHIPGNVSVYANGNLSWAGNDPNIVPVGKQWNETFNTITAGCAYDIDYIGNDSIVLKIG